MVRRLQKKEGGDLFVIEMAALLHDVDDWKFSGKTKKAKQWLSALKLPSHETKNVLEVIGAVSFKGAGVETKPKTIEAKIVQDADRLDAMGAIGIARCFAYGGFAGKPIYDPSIEPKRHATFSQYKKARTTSINHFYEKLLLLKGRMNTRNAKKIAEKRHAFMKAYLEEFFKEIHSP
jgi:uncharacterized protein